MMSPNISLVSGPPAASLTPSDELTELSVHHWSVRSAILALMAQGRTPNGGWWDGAVGYEVYVRSFADSDGDGIGDLAGVRSKLEHLAWLGVDIVWLTPFAPSPMADFGYDVADYCGVDPRFGTLDDIDGLLADAHQLGLKVVMDIVPNHTSDRHDWFVESRSSLDSDRRGYYHWRRPGPDGGPPNNWVSHFGGSAWTFDETTGQYYLHLFLPEQPDLNWNNPRVVREFDEILTFWLERGVDGFRIDVAHGLVKNMLMPDNPLRFPLDGAMSPRQVFAAYDHRYDLDQAGVLSIYRRWRRLADAHDALLLGEVYLRDNDPSKVSRYVASGDALHRAFYFAPMHVPWEPRPMWSCFRDALDEAPTDLSWAQSSHDDPRAPTRFGGGELGRARSQAYTVLLFALPGLPFLFQGDELALEDWPVPPDERADPVGTRNVNASDSRDNSRTPLPWGPGPNAGFSSAATTWLPVGDRAPEETVAVQRDDPASPLHAMRTLLTLRRTLTDLGDPSVPVEWLTSRSEPIIALRRGDTIAAINVGDQPAELTLPSGTWRLRYSSADPTRVDTTHTGAVTLAAPDGMLLTPAR
jgi:alpha-glucosidase